MSIDWTFCRFCSAMACWTFSGMLSMSITPPLAQLIRTLTSSGSLECSIKAAPSVLSNCDCISASFSPEFIAQSTFLFSSLLLSDASFWSVLKAAALVFITTYAHPREWRAVMASMSSPLSTFLIIPLTLSSVQSPLAMFPIQIVLEATQPIPGLDSGRHIFSRGDLSSSRRLERLSRLLEGRRRRSRSRLLLRRRSLLLLLLFLLLSGSRDLERWRFGEIIFGDLDLDRLGRSRE